VPALSAGTQPTVEQFKRVLEARLQKLKPDGTNVRPVLFQEVMPGKPNGGYYPCQVSAIIHDYGPGYPPNRFLEFCSYSYRCVEDYFETFAQIYDEHFSRH
jgi:hypothetical protein